MLEKADKQKVDITLEKYHYDKSYIIAIMQDVQKEYHYLPKEILAYVAKHIHVSDAKIYGVATFYENFSLKPKGKYVIKVCNGTACHVRNSIPILEEFRKQLQVTAESPTTKDRLFTVETVSCLGACGLAPVCTVNDQVHPSMTPEKVTDIIQKIKEAEAHANQD